jgi:uncharacterized protein
VIALFVVLLGGLARALPSSRGRAAAWGGRGCRLPAAAGAVAAAGGFGGGGGGFSSGGGGDFGGGGASGGW